VYLDFSDAIKRLGEDKIKERYGTCSRCMSASPAKMHTSNRCASIRRALHDGRTVGGLQPDGTVEGLHVIGEANFSDHGANRLGASALMQAWPMATSCCPIRLATIWRHKKSRARDRSPGVQTGDQQCDDADLQAPWHQGQAQRHVVSSRAWTAHVG